MTPTEGRSPIGDAAARSPGAGVVVGVASWWPAALHTERPDGLRLTLRPLRRDDRAPYQRLRRDNRDWVRPWEAVAPDEGREPSFARLRRVLERQAREGSLLPFVVTADDELVGQAHLFEVVWGSRRSGSIGYWLSEHATGRGIATWAVAMLADYALLQAGLHRLEVNIRPDNTASLAVAHRLDLQEEGRRRSYMWVDGAWRDHVSFVVLRDDLEPGGRHAPGLVTLARRRFGARHAP